jgi:type I restriction enzyme S subunit
MSSDLQPDDWPLITLGDAADSVRYGLTATAADEPAGPRFIRITDILGGYVDWANVPFCDAEEVDIDKYRAAAGDILIARIGASAGTAARVDRDATAVFASYLVRFRLDLKLADPRFVGYVLHSPAWHRHVEDTKGGSAQPQFNAPVMKSFTFRLPPLREQRLIASVLGAIDEKIANIERRCRLNTEMIAAMFSHYVLAQDEPGDFDGDLTSVARFVNGGVFTNGATGTGRPVLRIKELNSGISAATVFNDLDVKDENIARHGDLLFAWSGSLDVYRWHGPEALINQHIFKVLPRGDFPVWFVEGWLRHHLPQFQRIAQDKATTMGHIKREHLAEASVRIPPRDVIAGLDESLSPLDQQAGALARESTTLRTLRDELLPKLVSGEIRVGLGANDGDEPTELAA